MVCEFSTPVWSPFRRLYENYLVAAIPRIARLVSSNPVAYEYLAESIQAWPDQQGLADQIGAAGWRDVEWRNLSGGIVALHRARQVDSVTILLGATAAASCPVKTQNAFSPGLEVRGHPPDHNCDPGAIAVSTARLASRQAHRR